MADQQLVMIKNKLVLKDLINPKVIASEEESVRQITAGVIMGIARGIVTRTMPTGEFYEGLRGDFEAIRDRPLKTDDGEVSIIRSNVMFLGSFGHDQIAEVLKGENAPESVQFSVRVNVMRDSNAQGYTWTLTPLLAAGAADPLAKIREETSLNLAQLAAPKRDALEAPKGKAKEHAPA